MAIDRAPPVSLVDALERLPAPPGVPEKACAGSSELEGPSAFSTAAAAATTGTINDCSGQLIEFFRPHGRADSFEQSHRGLPQSSTTWPRYLVTIRNSVRINLLPQPKVVAPDGASSAELEALRAPTRGFGGLGCLTVIGLRSSFPKGARCCCWDSGCAIRAPGHDGESLGDDDAGDDYANALPPPCAFPTRAFTLHRFPISGEVVRVELEGEYLAPAPLGLDLELRLINDLPSRILECTPDELPEAVARLRAR